MKTVPRLHAEPKSLEDYRRKHPADDAASGADASAAWERFHADPAYKELRTGLVAAQGGLCAYCERRLTNRKTGASDETDQQIEHVLPKSGGAGRTLDWTNLMLCCQGGTVAYHTDPAQYTRGKRNVSCGQAKGDRTLGANCDPRGFPSELRLVDVGIDGKMRANAAACATANVDPTALDKVINETLNLNCDRLKVARGKIVNNISKWYVDLISELLEDSHLTEKQIEAQRMLCVAGRLQRDRHAHFRSFWTAERQYLEPDSSAWISQHAHLLGAPLPVAHKEPDA